MKYVLQVDGNSRFYFANIVRIMQTYTFLFAIYGFLNKNIGFSRFYNVALQTKTFAMDIKARIEEVISHKGLTKREVAERMGKFNQAFNSLITNPKWDTIEHVAQALDITPKDLLFGKIEGLSSSIDANSYLSERPEQSQTIGMLICPNCGKGIRINIEKGNK